MGGLCVCGGRRCVWVDVCDWEVENVHHYTNTQSTVQYTWLQL